MPLIPIFLVLLFLQPTFSCFSGDRNSLLSFFNLLSYPLNSSSDCCQWPRVACAAGFRVTHLSLPGNSLAGEISPSLSNLTSLFYFNISHNRLSGPSPLPIFRSWNRIRVIDLSFNRFSGAICPPLFTDCLPVSVRALDISNNLFSGSIDSSFLNSGSNLVSFNVSNNSFTGSIPSSLCVKIPRIEVLDFSSNEFSGGVSFRPGDCSGLRVFRAGFNCITGTLPGEVFRMKNLTELSLPANNFIGEINITIVNLSNLKILELQVNSLSGEIPSDFGLLLNLEQLQLHTNIFTGTLPPSLMNCSNLTTLLLRNNQFSGKISALDFSPFHKLTAVDFGNNTFSGKIPESLCLCKALRASVSISGIPTCQINFRNSFNRKPIFRYRKLVKISSRR